MSRRFLDPARPPATEHHLARVESVEDVGSTGRIGVRLVAFDGVDQQDAVISARLCVPFAGAEHGAFFVPGVGDEVLVAFVGGDPSQAVVLGALWNGARTPPMALGGDGRTVDRWAIVGKAGTKLELVEAEPGRAELRLETPNGASLVLSDADGGSIELQVAGNTLRLDTSGGTLRTVASLTITAPASMDVTAPTVSFSSGMVSVSGIVQCSTVTTSTVISGTYTPGAGNVW